jgi:positive regulator of sigma E activity
LGRSPVERKPQRSTGAATTADLRPGMNRSIGLQERRLLGVRLFHQLWPPFVVLLGLALTGAWVFTLGYAFFAVLELV